MRTSILLAIGLLASSFAAEQAAAAFVTFGVPAFRTPTSQEIDGGVPANAGIWEFFVTTDADILSVRNVVITAGLYNHPLAADTKPPHPALVIVIPALGADSWITTPGLATATAGGGFGVPESAWFDTTNDGPQTNFMFARLTSADLGRRFRGVVSIAGAEGPEAFAFDFPINVPEPARMAMAAIGMIGVPAVRRRKARAALRSS